MPHILITLLWLENIDAYACYLSSSLGIDDTTLVNTNQYFTVIECLC